MPQGMEHFGVFLDQLPQMANKVHCFSGGQLIQEDTKVLHL